jgi:exopolyphosphatase/guanosine-5'-triphosphate,3'-diphosphate pyrophosphatase
MQKIAIIDIGTNNFHLLIAEKQNYVNEQVTLKIIHKSKVFAFIGRGGINKQILTPDAIERALFHLQNFKTIIDSFACKDVKAIATSAIRNASNGRELIESIRQLTGIQVQVIDGNREAELIYWGVRANLNISKTSIIMDIGGGSVEFIICNATEIFWKHSFEIGAQRLLYDFQKTDPIRFEDILALNNFLEKTLQTLFYALQDFPADTLIGSAGSFDTIVDIYCTRNQIINTLKEKKDFDMPLPDYWEIHEDLISKDLATRLQIEGMSVERAEMISIASCLIAFIVKRLNITQMRVSAAALKEGVLWEWVEMAT